MEKDNYSQQELFEQKKYISDLIEEKSEKKRSSLNVVIGSSLLSSVIILSFLFLFLPFIVAMSYGGPIRLPQDILTQRPF